MLRYMFKKMLLAMQQRYAYDVRYQQDILHSDLTAFLKFSGFQTMASHRGDLPAGPLYAARIRAIIYDDCGPCSQLVANMALEAGLSQALVRAIIEQDFAALPADIALVVQFTERVLAHDPQADALRDNILALWGAKGLITLGFAISAYRVYPALKYSLGYGKACSRIQLNDVSVVPQRSQNPAS
ncbi:hypothetical protein [Rheinheimera maricola]|uniref:Carboxymuconolactone decarboxylase family protein n=1 Tax=Rheinheimera maricola TaxID=2793282 RepID=A0ABS7X609_9GAMM|nr:hypothetical protein [Rheinheimera maricola]MBZ9610153.1 hypothetical protein [Rheinheimera maricola]